MGDHADDMMEPYLRYGTVVCPIHQLEHLNDEWGCPFCEEGEPPKLPHRVYRPHQRKMDAYVSRVTHPFLFVHMRLGKTLVAVRRISAYSIPDMMVLVVAPYSAIDAWRKELRASGIEWTELFGTGEERRAMLPALRGWVLTNKEIWLTAPEIADMVWHVRVLDESTFVKNPFSKVTKFFNDPTKWPGLVHDWRLTGTPNPEDDTNFFGQTLRIWKHKNFHEWRGYWCVPFGMTWRVKPRLSQAFHGNLAKHCFFMSREDAGVSVRRIYETRLVRFTKQMRKIYTKLAKEFILEIPEGESWETAFAGAKYSWLRRLASGALPAEDGSIRIYWDGKLQELKYLLTNELKGEQVLIGAHFKDEVERIHDWLQKTAPCAYIHGEVSPKRRTQILKDFRAGKYRWVICQHQTVAYSTDVSFCDTIIHYSSPESGEIRQQFDSRTELADKKTDTLIIDIITEDTVDEKISRSQVKKESRAILTRELVRHLQKEAGLI